MGKLWRLTESFRSIWWAVSDGFETGVLWQIGVFWWMFFYCPYCWECGYSSDGRVGRWCVCWWSVCYSVVGLRVFFSGIKGVCSLLELFLTTATSPSSSTILNNITTLLPFVIKMSQQKVGSLVLTIVVDDLMSILLEQCTFPSIRWWHGGGNPNLVFASYQGKRGIWLLSRDY